jgi:hypothetical protein
MKKIIWVLLALCCMTGCSIFRKEKYGCPTDGRNVGAEKLLSGDEKTLKKAAKAKYRGRKSF